MPLLRQPALAEKIKCSVDGSETDMGFTIGKCVVQLLGCDVLHRQEGLEDDFALAGHSKLVGDEMFLKNGQLVLYVFFTVFTVFTVRSAMRQPRCEGVINDDIDSKLL